MKSKGMLNMLVRKHPNVGRLIPARFQDAEGLEAGYDLVAAIDVPGLDVDLLASLSTDLVIVAGAVGVSLLPGSSPHPRERRASVDL